MLELRLCNTALRLDFSFFAVLSLFFFFDSTGTGQLSLCACACHELGHLAVMTAVGARVDSLTFYGAGIRIGARLDDLKSGERAAVLAAGCAVNLLLCAAALLCGSVRFAAVNLMLGAFNLLPVGALDGAQLLALATARLAQRRAGAVRACLCALSVVLCAALAALSQGGGIMPLLICGYFLLLMAG